MVDNSLTAEAVLEFERVLQLHILAGRGLDQILKPVRDFCEIHGWDWFTAGTRPDFNRRCAYVVHAYSYGIYSNQRLEQLAEMDLWVYRAAPDDCPDHCDDLDGIALSKSHPFWQSCYPPLRPTCSCYVVGARSEKSAARLGGLIGKEPPAWTIAFDGSYTMETLLHDVISDRVPIGD
jgi:hypothetical protein